MKTLNALCLLLMALFVVCKETKLYGENGTESETDEEVRNFKDDTILRKIGQNAEIKRDVLQPSISRSKTGASEKKHKKSKRNQVKEEAKVELEAELIPNPKEETAVVVSESPVIVHGECNEESKDVFNERIDELSCLVKEAISLDESKKQIYLDNCESRIETKISKILNNVFVSIIGDLKESSKKQIDFLFGEQAKLLSGLRQEIKESIQELSEKTGDSNETGKRVLATIDNIFKRIDAEFRYTFVESNMAFGNEVVEYLTKNKGGVEGEVSGFVKEIRKLFSELLDLAMGDKSKREIVESLIRNRGGAFFKEMSNAATSSIKDKVVEKISKKVEGK